MSKYTENHAPIVKHAVRKKFQTRFPIEWHVGKLRSGFIYTVPPEFVFDVSVPWWATWLFDPTDRRFLKAAALHDHMLLANWDRPTAGAIFHDALKADGVSKLKRLMMFLGVSVYRWK